MTLQRRDLNARLSTIAAGAFDKDLFSKGTKPYP